MRGYVSVTEVGNSRKYEGYKEVGCSDPGKKDGTDIVRSGYYAAGNSVARKKNIQKGIKETTHRRNTSPKQKTEIKAGRLRPVVYT